MIEGPPKNNTKRHRELKNLAVKKMTPVNIKRGGPTGLGMNLQSRKA